MTASQHHNELMVRRLMFLLLIFSASATLADSDKHVSWSRLGIQFETSRENFETTKGTFHQASGEIADLITSIVTDLPSEVSSKFSTKDLVFIFETRAATDAVFYPPGTYRDSSEFIISINPALIGSNGLDRLVAHELFHAVHFAFNPNEPDWIREGLAQLFETKIFGGFNQAHVHASLSQSRFPLEAEFNIEDYQKEKYGNTFLYFYYLSTHCDPRRDLIWKMVLHQKSGRSGIDEILSQTSCRSFSHSAEMFSLARMVNAYSGLSQSDVTFLIPTLQKLSNDTHSGISLRLSSLGYFQPVRVSIQKAQELSLTAPGDAKFWGLEKNFPNRVRPIRPQEVHQLGIGWDVGIIRVN